MLVSGDVADHAADAEYEQARKLLAPLDAPLYVLPGNHDDRHALHRHFGVPAREGRPVQYATDLGPLRFVVLDSTAQARIAASSTPSGWPGSTPSWPPARTGTVIAMHHPPLPSGIPAMDEIGLPVADRYALGAVIARHAQVRRIVADHMHRTIAGNLGGRAVFAVPSTYVQARLDFRSLALEFTGEPPGFAVHVLGDGELIPHVQPVA